MGDKITVTEGNFEWDTGRYQPPSAGGGLPPGWFTAPHEESTTVPMPPPPVIVPVQEYIPPVPVRVGRTTASEFLERNPSNEDVAAAVKAALAAALPHEFVDLLHGTAKYMGYEIKLTEDSVASVRMILAMEVCLSLERERERVLATVQHQELQEDGGERKQDVPEVQGQTTEVDEGTPGESGVLS